MDIVKTSNDQKSWLFLYKILKIPHKYIFYSGKKAQRVENYKKCEERYNH